MVPGPSLRAEARRLHPDFPWLALDEPEGIERYLSAAGLLAPGERFRGCERAGEGKS